MFFPINNDKNYSDYKYGMGDLHQRLTELRRCLDDGLINQNGYDSARDEVINFWISELRKNFTFTTRKIFKLS
ncbi:uncharacterized protein OCT59_003043 [Rhizophagus irregularis]|nr:hypothetical protein OCT59_003043 [Rhizophagus irregularis]